MNLNKFIEAEHLNVLVTEYAPQAYVNVINEQDDKYQLSVQEFDERELDYEYKYDLTEEVNFQDLCDKIDNILSGIETWRNGDETYS